MAMLTSVCVAATPATDLSYGHYEIHIDYAPTPGNPDQGWVFSVSYDQDDDFSTAAGVVRLDPETTRMIASPASRLAIPSPAGVFARFGEPGTPIWVLPQNQALGVPFLGVRTTMPAGIFQARVGNNYTPSGQGSISLRLISVEGSGPDRGGHFATWKTESFGTTVFSFDTTDGISATDEIPTIPVSSHTHYNWGLTRPGIYRVTFEAQGKLMPTHGNVITRARKTFVFSVPHEAKVAPSPEWRVTAPPSGPPQLVVADPVLGVAYAPDQAMVESHHAATGASSALPGAMWETPVTWSTMAAALPDAVGIDPGHANAGLPANAWSGLKWKILDVRGPGSFALIEQGQIVAAQAGDEIDFQPDATRAWLAAFGQSGIYRVTGVLEGNKGGVTVTSAPVTMVMGAGVTADFDYATWALSFERSSGLPAGSLADPLADGDGDGVSNAEEFAFFWHGLDPARPDAQRRPRLANGARTIEYLRDTYKDPFNESNWRIVPAVSGDLQSWRSRSARVPGFPLEIFETGTGPGNADGRVVRRQLRVMPDDSPRSFFRFSITPP